MHEHKIERCKECGAIILACNCKGVRPEQVPSTRHCVACEYEEELSKAMRVEQTREWLDMDD